jgi:hypothetical protein
MKTVPTLLCLILFIVSCGSIDEDISKASIIDHHKHTINGDFTLESRLAILEKIDGQINAIDPSGQIRMLLKSDQKIIVETSDNFNIGKNNANFSINTKLYLAKYSFTIVTNAIPVTLPQNQGKQSFTITTQYPNLTLDEYNYFVIYDEVMGVITASGEILID